MKSTSFTMKSRRTSSMKSVRCSRGTYSSVIISLPQTLAPMPPLGQDILRLIATVAAYPLVVWVARTLAGLRRAAPGETEPG